MYSNMQSEPPCDRLRSQSHNNKNLHDPVLFKNTQVDLINSRTKEGIKVSKAKGQLQGKQPKLSSKKETYLVVLYRAGEHTSAASPNSSLLVEDDNK